MDGSTKLPKKERYLRRLSELSKQMNWISSIEAGDEEAGRVGGWDVAASIDMRSRERERERERERGAWGVWHFG